MTVASSVVRHLVSPARVRGLGVVTQKHSAAQIIAEVERRTGSIPNFRFDLSGVRDDPRVLAALNQTDLTRNRTTLESALELADAGRLLDGTPSGATAARLLGLAGHALRARNGRCYGRTSHSLMTAHHPGEFAHIMSDLMLRGETVLRGGQRVRWDPAVFNVDTASGKGPHDDQLWGSLNKHLLPTSIPNPVVLTPGAGPYAYKAQMANIMTRLFGEQHVNVRGDDVLDQLNDIVDRAGGPVMAEFDGDHGGSVAKVDDTTVTSFDEAGQLNSYRRSKLGYVVVRQSELDRLGVDFIPYAPAKPEQDYFWIAQ